MNDEEVTRRHPPAGGGRVVDRYAVGLAGLRNDLERDDVNILRRRLRAERFQGVPVAGEVGHRRVRRHGLARPAVLEAPLPDDLRARRDGEQRTDEERAESGSSASAPPRPSAWR